MDLKGLEMCPEMLCSIYCPGGTQNWYDSVYYNCEISVEFAWLCEVAATCYEPYCNRPGHSHKFHPQAEIKEALAQHEKVLNSLPEITVTYVMSFH